MENIESYNEEQFQMLKLAVTDTTSGMCLFQSYDAEEQVLIAERICEAVQKESCILNMSEINEERYPDTIGKLRALLDGCETTSIVILCNLQLCGAALGEEVFIERLNHMRDQMLSMGKVWVFGMSPYFASMLSRSARDLFSCIMGHFEFYRKEEKDGWMFEQLDFSGDVRLNLRRFVEIRSRVELKNIAQTKESVLLDILSVWNKIYAYTSLDMVELIRQVLAVVEKNMEEKELSATDCTAYLEAAAARYHLSEYKEALRDIELLEARAKLVLPKRSREIGNIFALKGMCCFRLMKFADAEKSIVQAISCYEAVSTDILGEKIEAIDTLIQIKTLDGSADEALNISYDLILSVQNNMGKDCSYLPSLWNNRGVVYAKLRRPSEALECLQKANELLPVSDKEKRVLKGHVLRNIGFLYNKMGNYARAVEYLNESEKTYHLMEDSFGKYRKIKNVYQLLSEVYHKISQEELSEKYHLLAEGIEVEN